MSFDKIDPKVLAGEATDAHKSSGVKPTVRTVIFETEVADAAGDIKALFIVGAHEIPVACRILNDAIAGATEIDVGLYRMDETAADLDALADGLDISAGSAIGSPANGLAALGIDEVKGKSFQDIVTDAIGAIPDDSYWVCLTLVSEVAAAGTINVELETIGR
ncbi:MAG: hypothetical protein JRJ45_00040 [Deltaproteobacteria bacterium]|nr:hypothetical protein [Deltaproteobacteria bacterium]